MKLTVRDKVIILILLLVMVIYGGYQMLWLPLGTKISKLEITKSQIEGLTADITPLLKQSEALRAEQSRLEKSVDDIKTTQSKTLAKEEFLVYLGKSAASNGVKHLSFNDFGFEENGGIYKAKFDFEIQGGATNINSILSAIDQMDVKYSVSSLSYRQAKDYDYLRRFFDSMTKLPWYQTAEEQQEEIQEPSDESISNNDMRLAVTVSFFMFEKPDSSNSFMAQSEGI
ncbi:MAG: hypothetical protein GX800_00115 [Clostridiaceae bacterium]|nr:hypothetical protein [Clostridiaceae bacterium]